MYKTVEYKTKIEYKSTGRQDLDKKLEDDLDRIMLKALDIPVMVFPEGEGDGLGKFSIRRIAKD